VTCAHVVADVGGAEQVRIQNKPAKVVVLGEEPLDLAILVVPELIDISILPLALGSAPRGTSLVYGYQDLRGLLMLGPVRLSLGSKVYFQGPTGRVGAWTIEGGGTELLQRGYSGGPVLAPDLSGVLAVTSHRMGQGERGLAIAIDALNGLVAKEADRDKLRPVREMLAAAQTQDAARPIVKKPVSPLSAFLPEAISATDKQRLQEVLATCYRRAIFARLHAQLDLEAMFDSLAECRVDLQRQVAFVESQEAQQLVAGIISNFDLIERCKPRLLEAGELEASEIINDAKLRTIHALSELALLAELPLTIPTGLVEDVFWTRAEADGGPLTRV
jgi:hypothetical protein